MNWKEISSLLGGLAALLGVFFVLLMWGIDTRFDGLQAELQMAKEEREDIEEDIEDIYARLGTGISKPCAQVTNL